MPELKKPNLPIGYWLKKADEALTTRINEAQQANGLTRTDWQVLNLLHEVAMATREQLADTLQPFVDADALGTLIERLVRRGLVEGEGSATAGYRLTDQGRRVHEAALMTQKEVRRQAVQGVSEADYATTIRVLQRLVENLTSGDPDQQPVATHDALHRR